MNEKLLVELERFLRAYELDLVTDDLNFIMNIGWKTKITLECKVCGQRFDITVKQLLRPHPERAGLVCPYCESERLFKNKLTALYGYNPYTFLSKFEGYNKPITVRCIDCGNEWTAREARNLLMNTELPSGAHPCKKCAIIRNFQKNIEEFEQKIVDKFGVCNYDFLDPENFTGIYSKKKIKVRCKKCGYEFSVSPQNLLYPTNGEHYCKNCNILKVKK